MIFKSGVDLASWEWHIWEMGEGSGCQDKKSGFPGIGSVNSPRLLTMGVTWWCSTDLKQRRDSHAGSKKTPQGTVKVSKKAISTVWAWSDNKDLGLAPLGKFCKSPWESLSIVSKGILKNSQATSLFSSLNASCYPDMGAGDHHWASARLNVGRWWSPLSLTWCTQMLHLSQNTMSFPSSLSGDRHTSQITSSSYSMPSPSSVSIAWFIFSWHWRSRTSTVFSIRVSSSGSQPAQKNNQSINPSVSCHS